MRDPVARAVFHVGEGTESVLLGDAMGGVPDAGSVSEVPEGLEPVLLGRKEGRIQLWGSHRVDRDLCDENDHGDRDRSGRCNPSIPPGAPSAEQVFLPVVGSTNAVAFDPSGEHLVTQGPGGVDRWHADGTAEGRIMGTRPAHDMVYSPDGGSLAVLSDGPAGQILEIIDADTGAVVEDLPVGRTAEDSADPGSVLTMPASVWRAGSPRRSVSGTSTAQGADDPSPRFP